MKTYSREDIEKIVPHRGRALLLDRVEISDDGKTATGYLVVTAEHCEGHFPGNPILRGVDRIEMAALTLCVVGLMGETEATLPLFDSCAKVVFRGMVLVGDELRAEVKVTEMDAKRMTGSATMYVGDKIVGSFDDIRGVKVSARVLERMKR